MPAAVMTASASSLGHSTWFAFATGLFPQQRAVDLVERDLIAPDLGDARALRIGP